MKIRFLCVSALAMAFSLTACGQQAAEDSAVMNESEVAPEAGADIATLPRTTSPAGARVFFISPANGDTVTNPVRIEFGIEGMVVAKAGDNQPDSGHHHLLIDTDLPTLSEPVPADVNHIHFGDGSTSTEITLEPGQHTLCLLLADHQHIPHDPPLVSNPITITVE